MKRIELNVESCMECPCCDVDATGQYIVGHFCTYKRNLQLLHRQILSGKGISEPFDGTIPSWCPLPDAKEEK